MGYLVGFVFVLAALAPLPLSASAQAGEEHSLSFWHDEALKIALFSSAPAPSPGTAPEEPALQLKLDDAGVEVAPSPPRGHKLGEIERRVWRAKIGIGVSTVPILVGGIIAISSEFVGGFKVWGEYPTPEEEVTRRRVLGTGIAFMGVGAASMIASGVLLRVRKLELRELKESHYGTPRRVQWDLAQSRVVF